MPTLENDGWELESAEQRVADSDGKFEIPSRHERESLTPGDRCKLLFLFYVENEEQERIIGCERMWVRIDCNDVGTYQGILESDPIYSTVLEAGARITFGPEHIATIEIPRTDPRHPDFKTS